MIQRVVALLPDQFSPFEYGVLAEIFGIDRTSDGVPAFDFVTCTPDPTTPVALATGGRMLVDHGLEALAGADLVVALPMERTTPRDLGTGTPQIHAALRQAHADGAILLSLCSAAFQLAGAGLLDGRRATTHWRYADVLRREFPAVMVDEDVLFVDDGDIVTSAGTAAGIDASLHLVRRELGSEVANVIARRMVVAPQRDGGQRQFIARPVPACSDDMLAEVMEWMVEHLEEQQPVARLAQLAGMSLRTFARRFVAETGTTPLQWLSQQRVLRARELLERTDLDVDAVAHHSGFSSSTLLRHHFRRTVGVTPGEYRRTFAAA